MNIPSVWSESLEGNIDALLRAKAATLARAQSLPRTLGDWQTWRTTLRELVARHANIQYDHDLQLDCKFTKSIQCDGYRIECLHFQSKPGNHVTGCLYIPEGEGPFPAVLNVRGHWAQGHLAERVQARCHSLAKNGFVCLSIDAWGAGERSWKHGCYRYHGNTLGGGLFQYGETLLGAQIADNMRAVDLLCSLPFVDSDNIGVTGASGGGNQTMWLAAMDERLKAAMPVVSVGTFESYVMSENCVCELLPNGLTFSEEDGILALVAPRYLKICNAMKDCKAFSVEEMLRSYNKARDIFKLYGSEDHFTYQTFNTVHGYWPEIREAMLGFFKMALMGKGNGAAISEIPFQTLPEEQIMTFEKGKRPDNFGTIEEYLKMKAASIPKREFHHDDAKAEFARFAKTISWNLEPGHTQIFDMTDTDGWRRFTLMKGFEHAIPVLYKHAPKGGRTYIYSCAAGKASLAESALLQKAIDDHDASIILFDAFATGELACDYDNRISPFHKLCRSLLWCGKTLMGEWAADFLKVASFALDDLQVGGSITLGSIGEMNVAACAAALAIATQSAIVGSYNDISVLAEGMPESFAFNGEGDALPEGTLARALPGFSNWGDIPALKQLMKAAGVVLINI